MNNRKKHIAFISYSHKNEAITYDLHKFLYLFHLPRAYRKQHPHLPVKKYNIYIDKSHLSPGTIWTKLKEGLNNSEHLIVICSKESRKYNEDGENWVNKEIDEFVASHEGAADLVYPILLEAEAGDEAIPQSLIDHNLLNNAIELNKEEPRISYCHLLEKILGIQDGLMWEKTKQRLRIKNAILKAAWTAVALFVAIPCLLVSYLAYCGVEIKSGSQLISQNIWPNDYKARFKQIALNNDLHTLELLLRSQHADINEELLISTIQEAYQYNLKEITLRLKKALKERAAIKLEQQSILPQSYPEAIHKAIADNNADLLSELLYAADSSVVTQDDVLVLHTIPEENTELIKHLSFHAALQLLSENIYPGNYRDAIITASLEGDIHKLRLLLQAGVSANSIDEVGESVLSYAARNGHVSCVKELIAARADLNYINMVSNTPAIFYAVYNEHLDCIKLMLPHTDTNALQRQLGGELTRGNLLQAFAIQNNKPKALQTLLNCGLKADGKQEVYLNGYKLGDLSLLTLAITAKSAECVKLLLNNGAKTHDANQAPETLPIYVAATSNLPEITQALIDAGADIRIKDHNHRSLLHIIAPNKATETIKILCKAGADVNEAIAINGETPLMTAAAFNQIENLHALIECGATLEAKDSNGCTALAIAAAWDNTYDTITALCKAKADINTTDLSGKTPLMMAAYFNKVENMRALITAGADVNRRDNNGDTALSISIMHKNAEAVKLLCQAGANATDTINGISMLERAVCTNSVEIAETLIKYGAHQEIKNSTKALFMAISNQSSSITELIIKSGGEINRPTQDGPPPLIAAIILSQPQIVRMLIEAGADVNIKDSSGSSALMCASLRSQTEIINMLMEAGADLNIQDKKGRTALYSAVLLNQLQTAQQLLACGKNNETTLNQALSIAAKKGYEKHVELLLDAGASPNYIDAEGYSILTYSVINQHEDIIPLLIKKGADPTLQKEKGKNALYTAVMKGNINITEQLLLLGADKLFQTPSAFTIGFASIAKGYTEILEILLKYGLSPNTISESGTSLLMGAVHTDNASTIRLLIEAGADLNYERPGDKVSALYMAVHNGKENALKELLQHPIEQRIKDECVLAAVINKAPEMVTPLLAAGANPNTANADGVTPLVASIFENMPLTAQELIKAGADINILYQGKTLKEIAEKKQFTECVRLLTEVEKIKQH